MKPKPPFTYSTYSTLRQCGRKFKYSVLDKLPQPPAVALEFGSALHAGLNDALVTKDSESAVGVFSAYWESSLPKLDFSEERYKAPEMGTLGNRFVANFQKRFGSKMKLIVGEERFKKSYSLPPMRAVTCEVEGTPDALVEWDGKNVLLDFKSSAYNYAPEKNEISLQLNLYAWLLECSGYRVDSLCYFVFTKSTGSIQTPIRVPYDRNKALEMINEAVVYWNRNLNFYERNYNSCIMGKSVCPYLSRCLSKPTESPELGSTKCGKT